MRLLLPLLALGFLFTLAPEASAQISARSGTATVGLNNVPGIDAGDSFDIVIVSNPPGPPLVFIEGVPMTPCTIVDLGAIMWIQCGNLWVQLFLNTTQVVHI